MKAYTIFLYILHSYQKRMGEREINEKTRQKFGGLYAQKPWGFNSKEY